MNKEDVLAVKEIQGNIIPGFRMPYQFVLGCKVNQKDKFLIFFKDLLPQITNMKTVMGYHEERISLAKSTGIFGKESFLLPKAKGLFWLNIAFGNSFIDQFSKLPRQIDNAFNVGLAARSSLLGDPTDPANPGNTRNWVIGGAGKEPDLLLIAASDRLDTLQDEIVKLKASLLKATIEVVYDENAERLDNDTEHFGFKDGVSQPEIRGYIDRKKTFLTPRQIIKGNEDNSSPEYSAPGKFLIWPGQFVFGYQKQSSFDFRSPLPATKDEKDFWIKNGSLMVFRRLNQDVKGFYHNTLKLYNDLIINHSYAGLTYEGFLAKFVGRKKDGTPLIFEGQETHGSDLNNFYFKTDTPEFSLSTGEKCPSIKGDQLSAKCPMFAHIRKVNPRDLPTDQGGPTDTATFRFLRRGISFGPSYNYDNPNDPLNEKARGLLFISYQTSIQDQFERVATKWMNGSSAPEAPVGFDMLVGQNGEIDEGRHRWCNFPNADASANDKIATMSEFITPTGGGYFFVPSLPVLNKIAGL